MEGRREGGTEGGEGKEIEINRLLISLPPYPINRSTEHDLFSTLPEDLEDAPPSLQELASLSLFDAVEEEGREGGREGRSPCYCPVW